MHFWPIMPGVRSASSFAPPEGNQADATVYAQCLRVAKAQERLQFGQQFIAHCPGGRLYNPGAFLNAFLRVVSLPLGPSDVPRLSMTAPSRGRGHRALPRPAPV